MTRATYTLAGVEGPLTGGNGLNFEEKDGIDYAPPLCSSLVVSACPSFSR